MPKLILLRHLKSQWNSENRFAGWVDNPLSKEGIENAKDIAGKLSSIDISVAYSSPLVRNEETILRVFEHLDKYPIFMHFDAKTKKKENFEGAGEKYLPVYVSEELNERYYGKLQGLNKEETIQKYGPEKVKLWRRSYKEAPPEGESLKEVSDRAVPFFKRFVERDLKNGKNVLVVASHNSLRALIKYIEKIPDKEVVNLELPFGDIIKYDVDDKTNFYRV